LNPALIIASKEGTEKSGVPKNITFKLMVLSLVFPKERE
jgi:hypothetical protein